MPTETSPNLLAQQPDSITNEIPHGYDNLADRTGDAAGGGGAVAAAMACWRKASQWVTVCPTHAMPLEMQPL
jgi:hypothetical protein